MFEMGLFQAVALSEFKRIHPSLPIPHEELLPELLNQFGVNDLSSAVEEAQRFSEWVKTWRLHVDLPVLRTMSVGIQAKNGGGFVNIQLQAEFPTVNGEDPFGDVEIPQRTINLAARDMLKRLMDTFDFLRETASVDTNSTSSNGVPSAPPPDAEYCMGDTLLIESKDGKTTYRIKGGKWSQWGAAVYPEVLRAANIPYESMGMGSHVLGKGIYVTKNDRGFAKVVKID